MNKVFEDESIKAVLADGDDYDFAGSVFNKTKKIVKFQVTINLNDCIEFEIRPNDYVSVIADDCGRLIMQEIANGKIKYIK